MKPVIGLAAPLFATSALAEGPPKVGNKPLVQVKPQAPMGCKAGRDGQGNQAVGVRTELRGAAPAETPLVPGRTTGGIPDAQQQQQYVPPDWN
jgi:hypothetical protein